MTTKDRHNIKMLYHFHRYSKASLGRLFGVSASRIKIIIREESSVTAVPLDECLLCELEESKQYFIDGNEENSNPQNKIMLCEACKRRIEHLQLRRSKETVKSQYWSCLS